MDTYEKKYKEALERARKLYKDAITLQLEQDIKDYEQIFPELAESEDEKIRKELIKEINGLWENDSATWPSSLKKKNKYIAWLEKQGEKPRYNIGDVLCDKSCTTLNKDAQPNFEIIDIRDGMYICDKGYIPISQQDEYELVAKKIEQKPAWSEEDEDRLNSCVDAINAVYKWDSMIDWLKSIKNRVQPKQEWSEEDESHIKRIIEHLEGRKKDLKTQWVAELHNKEINWLKSLKDRYTWKPNKEQMKALHDLNLTGNISYAGQGQTLIELYNDLKKLKE